MTQLVEPNYYTPSNNTPLAMDHDLADSFAKWSTALWAWSAPQKKRRAIIVLENVETESAKEPSWEESLKRQKLLNRRAIYIPPSVPTPIPSVINDGPKDQWQKWSLYRATHEKLRRNPLPLLESIHLRKMLMTLQNDRSMPRHLQVSGQRCHGQDEEDDDIPLGALMKSSQRRPLVKIPNKAYRCKATHPLIHNTMFISPPQYPNHFHYTHKTNLLPLRFN